MLFVLLAVIIFFWAVRSNQFEDLDSQSISILFDETPSSARQGDTDLNNTAEVDSTTRSKKQH